MREVIMGNHLKINYPEIYKELNELRQFVKTEIRDESDRSSKEFTSLTTTMRGSTNASFLETISLQNDKSNQLALSVEELLDFIWKSTEEMEQLDHELSEEIVVEEEK